MASSVGRHRRGPQQTSNYRTLFHQCPYETVGVGGEIGNIGARYKVVTIHPMLSAMVLFGTVSELPQDSSRSNRGRSFTSTFTLKISSSGSNDYTSAKLAIALLLKQRK